MTTTKHQISNADRDSLSAMPLCIVPLETEELAAARMVKNAQLDSVIEMPGSDPDGGQLSVKDLPDEFGWDQGSKHPDMAVLKKLAGLNSYDVYSLRATLKDLEIDVDDADALHLSEEKEQDLAKYMGRYTHPLIREIYGDSGESEINSFEDLLALFHDPDVRKALARLKEMAEKLGISPDKVPMFLDGFGDVFLSLSYYRQCLDQINPAVGMFLNTIKNLRVDSQLRDNRAFQDTTRETESILGEAMTGLTSRFDTFDRATNSLWHDMTMDRFREVDKLVRSLNTTNGGVLCALWVKMTAWTRAFPKGQAGEPTEQAEFIKVELKPGLDKIRKLERAAPQTLGF